MRYPRRRSYEDEDGREKRVDRSALRVIAKRVGKQRDSVDRELFVLDPKRPPERLRNDRR